MFLNPVLFGQYTAFLPGRGRRSQHPYRAVCEMGAALPLAVQLVLPKFILDSVLHEKKIGPIPGAARRPVRQKLDFAPHTVPADVPFIPVAAFRLFSRPPPIITGFLIGGFYALFVCGKAEKLPGCLQNL